MKIELECLVVPRDCTLVPVQSILKVSAAPMVETVFMDEGLVALDLQLEFCGEIDRHIRVVDRRLRVDGIDGVQCDDTVMNIFCCPEVRIPFVNGEGIIDALEGEDVGIHANSVM